MTPTRPKLWPPVTIHRLPVSNLMKSRIFPLAISHLMVSLTLISGSGYLIVLPSCVTKNGTPLGPVATFLTRRSLYDASSGEILWRTKRPLTSYKSLKWSPVFSISMTSGIKDSMLDHWVKQIHKAGSKWAATLVDLSLWALLWPNSAIVAEMASMNATESDMWRIKLTHESSRVCLVRPDFAVYLDGSLHDNLGNFATGQGILESIP